MVGRRDIDGTGHFHANGRRIALACQAAHGLGDFDWPDSFEAQAGSPQGRRRDVVDVTGD